MSDEPSAPPPAERPERPRDGSGGGTILARRLVRYALAPFVFLAQLLAALIVLFEEWGWRPLARFMAWLATFSPWAAVETWIKGLPPYASLAVFALPSVLLFPLKVVSLWLIAQGKLLSASALFVAAKMVSTAWIARVFMLTKPTLMQIGWFARAYTWFMPWKEHLFALIRSSWVWRYGRVIKMRVKLWGTRLIARAKPRVAAAIADVRAWWARVMR